MRAVRRPWDEAIFQMNFKGVSSCTYDLEDKPLRQHFHLIFAYNFTEIQLISLLKRSLKTNDENSLENFARDILVPRPRVRCKA